MLDYIIWSPNPNIIPGLDIPRWYGVLFALGFILSQQIMFWIFKQEKYPEKHVEKLTVYMVVATIIGARLGHCLFYDPDYYLSNPLEMLMIWKGGLASHGGGVGIILSIYLFSRKYPYNFLWLLDRLVIVVALTGAMIRTGNLMNSEMEGTPTNTPTYGAVYAGATKAFIERFYGEQVAAVSFEKGGDQQSDRPGYEPITMRLDLEANVEDRAIANFVLGKLRPNLLQQTEIVQHIDFGLEKGVLAWKTYDKNGTTYVEVYGIGTVRHLAQVYEALYCLVLMVLLFVLWKNYRKRLPAGFNFAIFMIILWSARFIDEYFKMDQVDFEADMTLNIGQLLSIPMALVGVATLAWIYLRKSNRTMADNQSEKSG